MTNEEMDKFEAQYPDIAKYWLDPQSLEQLQVPKTTSEQAAVIYESWDKAAKRLINSLWKVPNAKIFHQPVDPEALGIHDYFDMIKNPMDLGTIKLRLN